MSKKKKEQALRNASCFHTNRFNNWEQAFR